MSGPQLAPRSDPTAGDPNAIDFQFVDARDIGDDHAAELLAFLRSGFARWPFLEPEVSALDYLRWKISGPASSIGSYQGRRGGRLVYATLGFASWVRVGGVRRLRLPFLDACVAPEARGTGVFSSAVAHQDSAHYRCDFDMFERTAVASVQRLLSRRDMPLGNPIRVLSRVLAPSKVPLRRGGPRLVSIAGTFAAWAWSSLAARVRPATTMRPREASIDRRFDVLFETAAGAFDVIAERDAEFLRWRYGDLRGGRYHVRELVEGDRLLGYCALRVAEPRAFLADLLVLPDRVDAVEPLAADAIALARASGAAIVDCWLPRRHPYRAPLLRLGFLDHRDAGVDFHPVEATAEELAPLADPRARVHYTLGDTDFV